MFYDWNKTGGDKELKSKKCCNGQIFKCRYKDNENGRCMEHERKVKRNMTIKCEGLHSIKYVFNSFGRISIDIKRT